MKIQTRIVLTNDRNKPFMGIGVVWLLERIDRFGSIHAAANDMHMSYQKAIKMIKGLEENLKKEIVSSHVGGIHGGGSYLTPFAYKFLQQFRQLDSDTKRFGQKRFRRFLKSIK